MTRERVTLVVAISAAVVVGLSVAAYAYDSSRDDQVADGVKVAGVDIGGMKASAAERKLRAELTRRLDRPVRVKAAGRLFRLTPESASLAVDVDGMLDEALDRSRSGGLPGRVWRGITGSAVDAELPARVSYSDVSVRRFVRRVKRSVDRKPRDADVEFRLASLPAIPSETGLRLSYRRTLRLVTGALNQIGHGRLVRVDVKVTRAEDHDGGAGEEVPRGRDGRSPGVHAAPVQAAEAGEELQDRRRPGGPRDTGGDLPRAEQDREPVVARAGQRLGRRASPGR